MTKNLVETACNSAREAADVLKSRGAPIQHQRQTHLLCLLCVTKVIAEIDPGSAIPVDDILKDLHSATWDFMNGFPCGDALLKGILDARQGVGK